jgi:hypothetical protein
MMKELDVNIEKVKNGYTINVSYTDMDGDYDRYTMIAANYQQALEMIKDLEG